VRLHFRAGPWPAEWLKASPDRNLRTHRAEFTSVMLQDESRKTARPGAPTISTVRLLFDLYGRMSFHACAFQFHFSPLTLFILLCAGSMPVQRIGPFFLEPSTEHLRSHPARVTFTRTVMA
jgi:hypothetical protein